MVKAVDDVPCLIRMTSSATHDIHFIKGLQLPKGSIVTFDKAYINYQQYKLWSDSEVSWVTRIKTGLVAEVIDSYPLTDQSRKEGVLEDQIVILGQKRGKAITRIRARLVTYYDIKGDKILRFITNNHLLSPEIIAQIYKQRWQIELIFKRIKQNFPLKYFLGDNVNALEVQVWCVLIADLLTKCIMSKVKRKWSYSNICSMIRLHLMTYTHLIKFLENPDRFLMNRIIGREAQLKLFNSS